MSLSLIAFSPASNLSSPESTVSETNLPSTGGIFIKGKVLNKVDNSPIIGAAILIKDTKIGSLTDMNGHFVIKIPESPAELQFSFVNKETYTVMVNESGELMIYLDTEASNSRHKFASNPDLLQSAPLDINLEQTVKIRPDNNKQPLFVIDGVIQDREVKVQELDPDEIESLQVIKGKKALDKYGKKGKNGVIEITSKSKH